AKHVAAGELPKTIEVAGEGEIAELTRSFDEVVENLRQHRELEERGRDAERLSAVGKLASGVAHEIRNRLNFMNLSVDHIPTRLESGRPEGAAEMLAPLSNIKAELQRFHGMIENFLTDGQRQ